MTKQSQSAAPGASDNAGLQHESRIATFKSAKLFSPDNEMIPCKVCDLSASGARIIVETDSPLPQKATLLIPLVGITKKARLAWQNETEAGLHFTDDGTL